MSRIGKQLINITTSSVESRGDSIIVKGPLGELTVPFEANFNLVIESNEVSVVPKGDQFDSAKWGLYRSLLQNAVIGVEKGFERKLEMIGVGYRATKSANGVTLYAGYSHPVDYTAPKGVEIDVTDNTKISIKGIDKHLVGHAASQIRKVRKPEPYKGKGIKYAEEKVRRKPGKSGKAAA
ncbi:50S ribosomal protein L6 [bacterium]|nr:50S ribosomal protein L6 [bacterium]